MVLSFDENTNTFLLDNGKEKLQLPKETFETILNPEHQNIRIEKRNVIHDERTQEEEKLLESQYKDFFKQRDNTSYNFRHNFGIYCRKEASSPLDAIQIAKEITSRMDKDEQQKTYRLLKQLAKEDETITQVLVRTYLEAVKDVPLNEEYIKNHQEE